MNFVEKAHIMLCLLLGIPFKSSLPPKSAHTTCMTLINNRKIRKYILHQSGLLWTAMNSRKVQNKQTTKCVQSKTEKENKSCIQKKTRRKQSKVKLNTHERPGERNSSKTGYQTQHNNGLNYWYHGMTWYEAWRGRHQRRHFTSVRVYVRLYVWLYTIS